MCRTCSTRQDPRVARQNERHYSLGTPRLDNPASSGWSPAQASDCAIAKMSNSSARLPHFCKTRPRGLSIGSLIGTGSYGTVHAAELDGHPVAVKTIHLQLLQADGGQGEAVVSDFTEECQLLEGVEHPHIVRYLSSYYDEIKQEPVLVMEKMDTNLREFVNAKRGRLTRSRQIGLALDIAKGLHCLHTRTPPVVHRDLNDKNIMMDEAGIAKIGDFGQSKLKRSPLEYFQTKQPGAVVFMPPETMVEDPRYNEKVDIFSFGVLLLEIVTQRQPAPGLQGIGRDPEYERRSNDLQLLEDDHPLRQLILDCLKDDPHERPNIMEVLEQVQNLAKAHKVCKRQCTAIGSNCTRRIVCVDSSMHYICDIQLHVLYVTVLLSMCTKCVCMPQCIVLTQH